MTDASNKNFSHKYFDLSFSEYRSHVFRASLFAMSSRSSDPFMTSALSRSTEELTVILHLVRIEPQKAKTFWLHKRGSTCFFSRLSNRMYKRKKISYVSRGLINCKYYHLLDFSYLRLRSYHFCGALATFKSQRRLIKDPRVRRPLFFLCCEFSRQFVNFNLKSEIYEVFVTFSFINFCYLNSLSQS